MKVNTQSVNFNADKKLIDFIQKRMDKLDLFYDKVISSDVYLKVENTSDKENKIFEARVSVPGDSLVVKKQCKTLDRKSTRLNSSHVKISYAVFCLKKKRKTRLIKNH